MKKKLDNKVSTRAPEGEYHMIIEGEPVTVIVTKAATGTKYDVSTIVLFDTTPVIVDPTSQTPQKVTRADQLLDIEVSDYRWANIWKAKCHDTDLLKCVYYTSDRFSKIWSGAKAQLYRLTGLTDANINRDTIDVDLKCLNAVGHFGSHSVDVPDNYFIYEDAAKTIRKPPKNHLYYNTNWIANGIWEKFRGDQWHYTNRNTLLNAIFFGDYSYGPKTFECQLEYDQNKLSVYDTFSTGHTNYGTISGGGVKASNFSVYTEGLSFHVNFSLDIDDGLYFTDANNIHFTIKKVDNVYFGILPEGGSSTGFTGEVSWNNTFGLSKLTDDNTKKKVHDFLRTKVELFNNQRFILVIPYSYRTELDTEDKDGEFNITVEDSMVHVICSGLTPVRCTANLRDTPSAGRINLILDDDGISIVGTMSDNILDVFDGGKVDIAIKTAVVTPLVSKGVKTDSIGVNISSMCNNVENGGYVRVGGSYQPITVIPKKPSSTDSECYRGNIKFIPCAGEGMEINAYDLPETLLYAIWNYKLPDGSYPNRTWLRNNATKPVSEIIAWLQNGCEAGFAASSATFKYASPEDPDNLIDLPVSADGLLWLQQRPHGSLNAIGTFDGGAEHWALGDGGEGSDINAGVVQTKAVFLGGEDGVVYNNNHTSVTLMSAATSGTEVKDGQTVPKYIDDLSDSIVANDLRVYPTINQTDEFVIKGDPYTFMTLGGVNAGYYNPKIVMSYNIAEVRPDRRYDSITLNLNAHYDVKDALVDRLMTAYDRPVGVPALVTDMAKYYKGVVNLPEITLNNPFNFAFVNDDVEDIPIPFFSPIEIDESYPSVIKYNEWNEDHVKDGYNIWGKWYDTDDEGRQVEKNGILSDIASVDTVLGIVAHPMWKETVGPDIGKMFLVEEKVHYTMMGKDSTGVWTPIDFCIFHQNPNGEGYLYLQTGRGPREIVVDGKLTIFAFPLDNRYYDLRLTAYIPYKEFFATDVGGRWSFIVPHSAFNVNSIDEFELTEVDTWGNTDSSSLIVKYMTAHVWAGDTPITNWGRYGRIELKAGTSESLPASECYVYTVIDSLDNSSVSTTSDPAIMDPKSNNFLVTIENDNASDRIIHTRNHVLLKNGTRFVTYIRRLSDDSPQDYKTVSIINDFIFAQGAKVHPRVLLDVYPVYALDDNKWVLNTDLNGFPEKTLIFSNLFDERVNYIGIAESTGTPREYVVASVDSDTERVRIFNADSAYTSPTSLGSFADMEDGHQYRMIGSYNNREYVYDFAFRRIMVDELAFDFNNVHLAPVISFVKFSSGKFDYDGFFNNNKVDYIRWRRSKKGANELLAGMYVPNGKLPEFLLRRHNISTTGLRVVDSFSVEQNGEILFNMDVTEDEKILWSLNGAIGRDSSCEVYVTRDLIGSDGESTLGDLKNPILTTNAWSASRPRNGTHQFVNESVINRKQIDSLSYEYVDPPSSDEYSDFVGAKFMLDGYELPSNTMVYRDFVEKLGLDFYIDYWSKGGIENNPFKYDGCKCEMRFAASKVNAMTGHTEDAFDYATDPSAHRNVWPMIGAMSGDRHIINLVEQIGGDLQMYGIYTCGPNHLDKLGVCYKLMVYVTLKFTVSGVIDGVGWDEDIGIVTPVDPVITKQGIVQSFVPPELSFSVYPPIIMAEEATSVTNTTDPRHGFDKYVLQIIGSNFGDITVGGVLYENSIVVSPDVMDINDITFDVDRYIEKFDVTLYGFSALHDLPLRVKSMDNVITVLDDSKGGVIVRGFTMDRPQLPFNKEQLHIPPNEWLTADNFNRVIDNLNFDMDYIKGCGNYIGKSPIDKKGIVASYDSAGTTYYGDLPINSDISHVDYQYWKAMSGLSMIRRSHAKISPSQNIPRYVYVLRDTVLLQINTTLKDGNSTDENAVIVGKIDMKDYDSRITDVRAFDVNNDGDIFVLIENLHRIFVLRDEGSGYKLMSIIGGLGGHDAKSKFYHPLDMRFDNDGRLWVFDYRNGCFKYFTDNGSYLGTVDLPDGLEEFGDPLRFVVKRDDDTDRIFILYKDNVAVIENGELSNVWFLIRRIGSLTDPFEIHVDSSRTNLYIVYSNAVMKYTMDGTLLSDLFLYHPDGTEVINEIRGCIDSEQGLYVILKENYGEHEGCVLKNEIDFVNGYSVINEEYYNKEWKVDDMYVDRDESIQDTIVNTSFQRFTDNLRLLLHSLNGKIVIKRERVGDTNEIRGYMDRADLELKDVVKVDTDIKNTIFVGINEIVTADVINRCVDRLYTYMNLILEIITDFYNP